MGFLIALCALFGFMLAMGMVARFEEKIPAVLTAVFAVIGLLIAIACAGIGWNSFLHPSMKNVPPGQTAWYLWHIGAALAGVVVPWTAKFMALGLEHAGPRIWRALAARFRTARAWWAKFARARRERRTITREAREARRMKSRKHWLKLARVGAKRMGAVAKRNPEFWEPLMAFVRVLCGRGRVGKPPSELDRLLAWIRALERDRHAISQDPPPVEGFEGNRSQMRQELETRLAQAWKLVHLLVAMALDTDDDMRVIERDLPTGRSWAEECRDKLADDFRTLLDQIELTVGASPRRAGEETLRRADEEVAKLTSGELRAVAANEEIDDLLKRAGLPGWEETPAADPDAHRRAGIRALLAR